MIRYLVLDQLSNSEPLAQNMRQNGIPAEIVSYHGMEFLVWQTAPGARRPIQTIYRVIQPITVPVLGTKGPTKTKQTLAWYSDESRLSVADRRHIVENVTVFDIVVHSDETAGLVDNGYQFLPVHLNCVDGYWHYYPH